MRERAGWAFAYVSGVAVGIAAACAARSDAGARARVKVSVAIDGLIQSARAALQPSADDVETLDSVDNNGADDACDPGLDAAFMKSANAFKTCAFKVPDGVALELYALYSVATKGAATLRNVHAPSAFDVIA